MDISGKLNGLDLFSGIGGLSIALRRWVQPIAYCENDRYAQAVLLSRMSEGSLPEAPIWDDVQTLMASEIDLPVDIIYAGFPCQDISCAGTGKGLAGKRSGLFFEIIRLMGELRPRFVFLENVPAVTTRGGIRITAEITSLRYDCRWGMLSAQDVGANHKRERWFLLAHTLDRGSQVRWSSGNEKNVYKRNEDVRSKIEKLRENVANTERNGRKQGPETIRGWESESSSGCQVMAHTTEQQGRPESKQSSGTQRRTRNKSGRCGQDVADASGAGLERQRRRASGASAKDSLSSSSREDVAHSFSRRGERRISGPEKTEAGRAYAKTAGRGWWYTEPDVGRVAHGIPFRVDRLKGLGNAVVPPQAKEAFKRLMGLKKNA